MRVQVNGEIVTNDDKWLYDWFGIEATAPADIRAALEGLGDGEELELEINSGGGMCMAGFEIYSLLRQSGRRCVAVVQSLAASAASTILQGCTVRRISPVGQVMIHNPAVCAQGTAADMAQAQQMLTATKESILNAYELRCGDKCGREELARLMDEARWMSAQEAVERGLADEIITQADETAPAWAGSGLVVTNAAGGTAYGALLGRYEQLVRSGARQADPGHPVAGAPRDENSDPTAQGAGHDMGWRNRARLDMEHMRFNRR